MERGSSPLLTDLYQLNMIEAYLAYGETNTAVFELFVRKLPARRGFLVAAGLQQALEFLEDLRFSAEEIDWLRRTGRFSARTLDYLAQLRFTGDVHAFAEGTVFFANEPILRVTTPLPEAQLVEARLQAPEAADEGTRHWVSDGKNVSSAPMPAASSAASWAAVRACSDPSVATRMRFIWTPLQPLMQMSGVSRATRRARPACSAARTTASTSL